MQTAQQKSEAGKLKYILVWCLASAMVTIITKLPDMVFAILFAELVEKIGLHGAYTVTSGTIGLLEVLVTLAVYALFRNVYIQRVMPFFWLAGALGFLTNFQSWHEAIGDVYIDSGLLYVGLFIQFMCIFLLYWIPSTFWPHKYYIARTGHVESIGPDRITPKSSELSQKVEPMVRREPTLSAPKRD